MDEVFVRCISLPSAVNAVTLVDDDGNYNVYVNNRLSYYEQKRALRHELYHIKKNHLYCDEDVESCENEAKSAARPIYY